MTGTPTGTFVRARAIFFALLFVIATGVAATDAAAQATQENAAARAVTPSVFDDPAIAIQFAETITADELAAHLYIFASDFFEGREATARGQRLAAKYLASQYSRAGLTPYGTFETDDERDLRRYFQPFHVYSNRLQSATLEATRGGEVVASSHFGPGIVDGDSYLLFGTEAESSGEVVFAGYGIRDQAAGYDDYEALADAGIDASGRWLLILGGEPTSNTGSSLLSEDGEQTNWTENLWSKYRAASQGGQMRGMLIVNDLGPTGEDVSSAARNAAEALSKRVGSISLSDSGPRRSFPPVHVVSSEFANALLEPTGRDVAAIKEEIDASLSPVVMSLDDVQVSSHLVNENVQLETENVLAVVEGTDPSLKHEYVIVTSHYDHVGIDPTLEGDQIFNGADDDGSGTVALLEIAEAFQRARDEGFGPRRSVMFLNVTAEEKGLLGSQYYADVEPVVPLENTVANLNIDMIGRHDPTYPGDDTDYVYIIGGDLISQDIHDLNEGVNSIIGSSITLSDRFNSPDDPNQFFRRSDHWNFGKHDIPFIFYFTGTHDDYHGVGDSPDKIDYERLERIARLVFGTTWQLANQDERPQVSGTGFN